MFVDGSLCTGHGRCYALAPEVFEPDEEGYSAVRDVAFEVAPEHAAPARHGAVSCPEGAITVAEDA
ncbi:ferredoxin [Amycolatopsis thermoflava]|uniref:ferredoxin n=1 Tax=Amycolatopsis thermoflava TaxID=84480 RepID=UPI00381DE18C